MAGMGPCMLLLTPGKPPSYPCNKRSSRRLLNLVMVISPVGTLGLGEAYGVGGQQ